MQDWLRIIVEGHFGCLVPELALTYTTIHTQGVSDLGVELESDMLWESRCAGQC
jgi:hypothetical protein